jgi:hypothetical protein
MEKLLIFLKLGFGITQILLIETQISEFPMKKQQIT